MKVRYVAIVAAALVVSSVTAPTVLAAPLSGGAVGTHGWSKIASLPGPRLSAVAAGLPDGRVLVGGGRLPGSSSGLASALTYNPATNSWTAVGDLGTPRFDATTATLADGRVLVMGGAGCGIGPNCVATYPTDAEIFDASTNTFTESGPLPGVWVDGTVVTLSDGRVFAVGG